MALPVRPGHPEIVFGCSISMTGRYTTEGRRVIEGYDLWVERVNRDGGLNVGTQHYPVRIIYYDDQSRKDKVKQNITKLIKADQVDFLLGPFSSGLTLVASEIAETYGKILIETCGASEVIFSKNTRCTFAALTSASWYTRDFFLMMSEKTSKQLTYAVIAKNNLFSKSVAKGARIWGSKMGYQEVYYKTIDTDMDNWLIFLEELSDKSPDIIVFAGHYKDSIQFVEQLSVMTEFHPKAVVMTLGPTQKNFVKDLGSKSEYMIGISQWSPRTGYKGPVFGSSWDYALHFKDRYGNIPTYQNAQATAGCVIYQLAIEQCKRLEATAVLNNIRKMNTELFYGKIKFDNRGLNIGHPMIIIQIQEGKQRLIWPENNAEYRLIYPIPA